MLIRIKTALTQYFLPKRLLTVIAGSWAEHRGGCLTRWAIALFIRIYKVDMKEAQQPNISAYSTFNEFFIRPLRNNARPIHNDPNVLVLPADGTILQLGSIQGEQVFQAKAHYYSLEALLAGNESMIASFRNGSFVTTYLAPHDYHRIHMPCNGVLREMMYVPGKLFSVNPLSSASIPNLLTRNKRVICLFDTNFGPMAQILVGATIIGNIETVWGGALPSSQGGKIKRWQYPHADADEAVIILKGQEMGRFKLGSTVINLFPAKNVLLYDHLFSGYVTRVGQCLARGITQI
ncbi:archaetidylserine decarboxylase [Candidatus Steffania adelgidicola]|uniref:archaetidylserine decarboxylase n=1 Tax=Candidatus Steffania adelgidicola TaxID=1076626 RepID=UPI001D0199DF|nr:archaetidylserine decarboxylase [Candidatus Steffania adelgidicola]UDG79680.1 Phosphatidylserine decarboxylase proenzyme [Candidatus Steffania adelgidicola]